MRNKKLLRELLKELESKGQENWTYRSRSSGNKSTDSYSCDFSADGDVYRATVKRGAIFIDEKDDECYTLSIFTKGKSRKVVVSYTGNWPRGLFSLIDYRDKEHDGKPKATSGHLNNLKGFLEED